MNHRFVFYTSEKVRTHEFGRILQAGARHHGDIIDILPQDDFVNVGVRAEYDGAIKLGMSRSAGTIRDAYLAAGKHYLYCDKSYDKAVGWRVSIDRWQPLDYFQRYHHGCDRYKMHGVTLRTRKRSGPGAPIVFAAACQSYCNYFKLGNVNDVNREILTSLRNNTDRKIIYRPNPSWYKKHRDEFTPVHEALQNVELSEPDASFGDVLRDCHLLVTHGSSAALQALERGIPIMVYGDGIARSMGLTEDGLGQINTPWVAFPKESVRKQFYYDLSYCQWSWEELQNGTGWGELRSALAYLDKQHDATPDETIAQYRQMHRNARYFRGLSTLKYANEIATHLRDCGARTLLDYGCGKGEQYAPPNNLQQFWKVDITKYDPGVPGIDVLPPGQYDAVICCDVLEHVHEEQVQSVLQQILAKAQKFVYLAIASKPAGKCLPDGRNCHLTLHDRDWWCAEVSTARMLANIPQHVQVFVEVTGADDD